MLKHMERAFALLILLILTSSVQSQELLWSAHYGGQYNEFGNSCRQTSEGDLLILGSTFSYGSGSFDFYLIRVDSSGHQLFSETYGGASTEYGYDLAATSDGGFVMVGSTKSFGAGERDVYLVKVDAYGDVLWSRTYGGANDDEGRSVRQTADNGFIICGGTYSSGAGYQDVLIIKTDASGNVQWQRTFGGTGGESGSAVRQMPDGGYIVVGSTGSFGDGYSSIYVIRTNTSGDLVWSTTYGGLKADYGYSVEIARDGGLVFVGATASYGAGSYDAYVIRTDPDGNIEWERTFGGSDEDRAYAIAQTANGDYVLSGSTLSYSSSYDVFFVRISPVGDRLWSRNYGGSESDYCENVLIGSDNSFWLVGRSYSYTSGGSDLYLLKVEGDYSTGINELISDELPTGFELAQNYPNPFNMTTAIEYSLTRRGSVTLGIYNILGQLVKEWSHESLAAGSYRFEWDGTNQSGREVSSGVYFYRLQVGQFVDSKKMILMK